MVWWLSPCRYKSVWVGFLYTLVLKLPSGHGVTKVSRKGMDPSSLVSSIVNWIFSSMEFIWLMKLSFWVFLMMTRGQNKPYMVPPYVRGLSESMKNICSKHGVQVHYRGGNTIKGLLMTPKDKDHITMKSGIIYRFKCQRLDCDDEYIWESSRTFGERFKEHLKAPTPIYDHKTSQVMIPPFKTSALWGKRTKTSSEP